MLPAFPIGKMVKPWCSHVFLNPLFRWSRGSAPVGPYPALWRSCWAASTFGSWSCASQNWVMSLTRLDGMETKECQNRWKGFRTAGMIIEDLLDLVDSWVPWARDEWAPARHGQMRQSWEVKMIQEKFLLKKRLVFPNTPQLSWRIWPSNGQKQKCRSS